MQLLSASLSIQKTFTPCLRSLHVILSGPLQFSTTIIFTFCRPGPLLPPVDEDEYLPLEQVIIFPTNNHRISRSLKANINNEYQKHFPLTTIGGAAWPPQTASQPPPSFKVWFPSKSIKCPKNILIFYFLNLAFFSSLSDSHPPLTLLPPLQRRLPRLAQRFRVLDAPWSQCWTLSQSLRSQSSSSSNKWSRSLRNACFKVARDDINMLGWLQPM